MTVADDPRREGCVPNAGCIIPDKQSTEERITLLCRMQGEAADESQAGTTSNQENENEDDKEEDFDASEQWHPNNPYRVQVDLPNVLSDALF